eukprot:564163-Amorphochlora_amoeboformis.AAC.1
MAAPVFLILVAWLGIRTLAEGHAGGLLASGSPVKEATEAIKTGVNLVDTVMLGVVNDEDDEPVVLKKGNPNSTATLHTAIHDINATALTNGTTTNATKEDDEEQTPIQITKSKITDDMHSQGIHTKSKHKKTQPVLENYLPTLSSLLRFTGAAAISYITGKVFPYFGLPLVSGYLLFGIIFGPEVSEIISRDSLRSLRVIDEVALAFIALVAGAQLQVKKLRGRSRSIRLTTVNLVFFAMAFGSVVIFALRESISFMKGMSILQSWAIAMLGGVLLVARSPASAIAIRKELNAEGPFTATVMGTTIIMDVVVIVLFALVGLIANGMLADSSPNPVLLGIFVTQIVLSLAGGLCLGLLVLPNMVTDASELFQPENGILSFNAKVANAAFTGISYSLILLLGFTVFFASHALEPFLEPLVTCMTAGFAVSNFTTKYKAFQAYEDSVGPYVNAAFFTLTGASLQLNVLFGMS